MTTTTMSPDDTDRRVYRVEGFGEVGHANLMGFIPHPGKKHPRDLEVNECTTGVAQMCANRDVIRVWRTS
jgi:hypothetical protein